MTFMDNLLDKCARNFSAEAVGANFISAEGGNGYYLAEFPNCATDPDLKELSFDSGLFFKFEDGQVKECHPKVAQAIADLKAAGFEPVRLYAEYGIKWMVFTYLKRGGLLFKKPY